MGTYLGIDIGTSSVKALISSGDGKVLSIGQKEYPVLTPMTGYAEQDPTVWWRETIAAIKQALSSSLVDRKTIRAIGLSGQMHGLVALDKNFQPVCNAIIHLDQRSVNEREEILQIADDLIENELVNIPGTGMLLCSLFWIKKNRPREYERIKYVLSPKDYIRFCLTGELGTDRSDASASLVYSIRHNTWCDSLITRLGLSRDFFSDVHLSTEVSGTVTEKVREELDLLPSVPVVYGAGDCLAASVGNNIVSENDLTCNIGTASQMAIIVNKILCEKEKKCQLWCSALDNYWIFQGGSLNGGKALNWLKNSVLEDKRSYRELDLLANQIPVGSEGLTFLPYLVGERSPYNNPKATGAYLGLTLKHSKAHLLRATMEGITLNLNVINNIFLSMGFKPQKVIASGGAAKSTLWKQIQADIFNLPVYTTASIEEAAFGASILAAVGIGDYSSVQAACERMVILNERVTFPIQKNVVAYKELQEQFEENYYRVEEKQYGC